MLSSVIYMWRFETWCLTYIIAVARWLSAHTTILKNLFLVGKGGGVCEDCDARGAGEL